MTTARPHAIAARWSAPLARLLWWIGGLALVVALASDVDYAVGSGHRPFVAACGVGLIAAYAVSARSPTVGLIAVCGCGVVLAVGVGDDVPDAILTAWTALVFTSGIATFGAPLLRLPWLAGGVVVTVAVTGNLLLDEMVTPGVIGLTPFMAMSIAIGAWRRVQRAQQAQAVVDAREAERAEIARELHDVVAHHVTAIVIRAQAGQFSPDPSAPRAALAAIESEGAAAMAAMRRMVASLRTTEIPTLSTDMAAELDDLATTMRACGLTVETTIDEVPTALAPTIVRLTREAFTNVRKHADDATHVRLSIRVCGDVVQWSVVDDGRGVEQRGGDGFGLVGLRERVETLQGTFSAGPCRDGWEVRADLPRGNAT